MTYNPQTQQIEGNPRDMAEFVFNIDMLVAEANKKFAPQATKPKHTKKESRRVTIMKKMGLPKTTKISELDETQKREYYRLEYNLRKRDCKKSCDKLEQMEFSFDEPKNEKTKRRVIKGFSL